MIGLKTHKLILATTSPDLPYRSFFLILILHNVGCIVRIAFGNVHWIWIKMSYSTDKDSWIIPQLCETTALSLPFSPKDADSSQIEYHCIQLKKHQAHLVQLEFFNLQLLESILCFTSTFFQSSKILKRIHDSTSTRAVSSRFVGRPNRRPVRFTSRYHIQIL